MKLADIMVAEAMVPTLEATTRDKAIEELVSALVEAGALPKRRAEEAIKAILAREGQATTGIGKGIALPHARLGSLKKPIATIGRAPEGIEFSALDSKPVYSVILLLTSNDNPDEHLQAMEAIFKQVQRDIFRKFLRQSETKKAIADLILEADRDELV